MIQLFSSLSLLHTPRLWGRLFGPAPAMVQPLAVGIRALDRVYTEVRVDGDAQYSGWMETGQEMGFEAQQEVYVWCHQADKLVLTVNRLPAGTLGALTDTPPRTPSWYTFRNGDVVGL